MSVVITNISSKLIRIKKDDNKEGFFKWDLNAYIYYKFEEDTTIFGDNNLIITYIIAGNNLKMRKRLELSFNAIIDSSYGPIKEE